MCGGYRLGGECEDGLARGTRNLSGLMQTSYFWWHVNFTVQDLSECIGQACWRSTVDSLPEFGVDVKTDDATHTHQKRVWKSSLLTKVRSLGRTGLQSGPQCPERAKSAGWTEFIFLPVSLSYNSAYIIVCKFKLDSIVIWHIHIMKQFL